VLAAKQAIEARDEYGPDWVEQQSKRDLSESDFLDYLDNLEDTRKINREKSRLILK